MDNSGTSLVSVRSLFVRSTDAASIQPRRTRGNHLFSEGHVIGRNSAFQNGFGSSIKTEKDIYKITA